MKTEIADELIRRLGSGRYKKTTGRLKERYHATGKTCYCALGVLSQMASEEGVVETQERARNMYGVTVTEFNGEAGFPPEAVLEWAGFADRDNVWEVINLNDDNPDDDFAVVIEFLKENAAEL